MLWIVYQQPHLDLMTDPTPVSAIVVEAADEAEAVQVASTVMLFLPSLDIGVTSIEERKEYETTVPEPTEKTKTKTKEA